MDRTPEELRHAPLRPPSLILTSNWTIGAPGGVARHVRELARHLALAGARVAVVCVEAAGYSGFPRPRLPAELAGHAAERALADAGVELVRVRPHAAHWLLDGVPVRRAVARLLAEREVDAVLSFFNEGAFLPGLCARHGARFGYVATWLSYRMALAPERQGHGLRGLVMRAGTRRLIVAPHRAAQVVFANSEFTREELVDVVGVARERIAVTYLGVDPSFATIERRAPQALTRFVFFGRMVREKGILDAIDALARLGERDGRDWSLHAIGSGDHAHVRRFAERRGVSARVRLSAHMDDASLRAALADAELALLPSWSESFGLAIAEAQAAALPVVAYAAGSVPEVVEDGVTAWLAPVRDVAALAERLHAACADPEGAHRMGLAGRARALALFRWERTAARLLAELGPAPAALRASA